MSATEPQPAAPKPKLRWYQYSLRTLFVFVMLCALPCSWVAVKKEQGRRQAEAVAQLKMLDAEVLYDWQRDANGNSLSNAQLPGPAWLRPVLGEDFFQQVAYVWLQDGQISITDAGLEHLKGLSHLEDLHILSDEVSDAGLQHLEGLTRLRKLALSGRFSDTGLVYLKGMNQLQSLDLWAPKFTGAGLEYLKAMSHLQSLGLNQTEVTDDALKHLEGMSQLQSLFLAKTKITDAGVERFKGLSQLQLLGLSETKITDAALERFKGMSQLTWLNLEGTEVTNTGVKKLRQALPNCRISWSSTPDVR